MSADRSDGAAGPSDAEVAMARYAAERLAPGARLRVEEFSDRSGGLTLDVATFPDTPLTGIHTATTLSLHRNANDVDGQDHRIELVTVLEFADAELVAGLLVACGFSLVKENHPGRAGTVFPDVCADLFEAPVPHLLLTSPVSFPGLSRYSLAGEPDVHWLQAVPLHESEREFLEREGLDALEDAFDRAGVDVADLWRNPVPLPPAFLP